MNHRVLLQCISIALIAEHCISYSQHICLSVPVCHMLVLY